MSVTDKSKVIVPKGFYGKTNVLQGFNPETESIVDITTVRNTSGAIVNEAGNIENVPANVPRRDHAKSDCGALLVEPQRTNLFLNSETASTQTISVTSGQTYAVSFSGTGSITFSGGASGTLTGTGSGPKDRVSTQITPNTNSVLCTVSGTVKYVNFEELPDLSTSAFATSWIESLGATATRNADEFNIDLSTENVPEQYALLFNVDATGGRLLMESTGAGFDLDLKNKGRFAMLVDLNTITFKFPDNGQPQTELVYEKPADFRGIEFTAKLGPVRIEEAIWTEQLQTAEWQAWLSGTISSSFLETDWSAQTNFFNEFRNEDWEYFPAIDLSNGTNFKSAWQGNSLTSFPAIDLSSGIDFEQAWYNNNLTSFPANMFDTNNTGSYSAAFRFNDLDQQSVDDILVSIEESAQANNITNGILGIAGGTNATPSATGQAAADSLRNTFGWSVNLNGY